MVQGRYITDFDHQRADQLRLQYNEMVKANLRIRDAGGTMFDDDTLKGMFDNSLPPCYEISAAHVSRANHDTFQAHFNDYVSMARKSEASIGQSQTARAFAVQPGMGQHQQAQHQQQRFPPNLQQQQQQRPPQPRQQQPYSMPQPSRQQMQGPRGPPMARNTLCFRCLSGEHQRRDCPAPPVSCAVCGPGVDHHSSLHSRQDLSFGQRQRLIQDAKQGGEQRPLSTSQSSRQARLPAPAPVAAAVSMHSPDQGATPAAVFAAFAAAEPGVDDDPTQNVAHAFACYPRALHFTQGSLWSSGYGFTDIVDHLPLTTIGSILSTYAADIVALAGKASDTRRLQRAVVRPRVHLLPMAILLLLWISAAVCDPHGDARPSPVVSHQQWNHRMRCMHGNVATVYDDASDLWAEVTSVSEFTLTHAAAAGHPADILPEAPVANTSHGEWLLHQPHVEYGGLPSLAVWVGVLNHGTPADIGVLLRRAGCPTTGCTEGVCTAIWAWRTTRGPYRDLLDLHSALLLALTYSLPPPSANNVSLQGFVKQLVRMTPTLGMPDRSLSTPRMLLHCTLPPPVPLPLVSSPLSPPSPPPSPPSSPTLSPTPLSSPLPPPLPLSSPILSPTPDGTLTRANSLIARGHGPLSPDFMAAARALVAVAGVEQRTLRRRQTFKTIYAVLQRSAFNSDKEAYLAYGATKSSFLWWKRNIHISCNPTAHSVIVAAAALQAMPTLQGSCKISPVGSMEPVGSRLATGPSSAKSIASFDKIGAIDSSDSCNACMPNLQDSRKISSVGSMESLGSRPATGPSFAKSVASFDRVGVIDSSDSCNACMPNHAEPVHPPPTPPSSPPGEAYSDEVECIGPLSWARGAFAMSHRAWNKFIHALVGNTLACSLSFADCLALFRWCTQLGTSLAFAHCFLRPVRANAVGAPSATPDTWQAWGAAEPVSVALLLTCVLTMVYVLHKRYIPTVVARGDCFDTACPAPMAPLPLRVPVTRVSDSLDTARRQLFPYTPASWRPRQKHLITDSLSPCEPSRSAPPMANAVFLAPVSPSMEQSFMELVACLCRFQRDPAVRAVSSMLLLCTTVSAIPTYSLPWWAALSAAAWVVTPMMEQAARVELARAQDSVRPTTSRPPPRSPRSQHGSAAGTASHAHPEHSAGHIPQAPPHRSRSRARGRSPRVTQGLPLADVLQPAAPHQHASPTFPETQPGENPATLTVERDDGLVSLRLIDHTANGDLYPPTGVVRSHDSVHGDAAVLTLERLDGRSSVFAWLIALVKVWRGQTGAKCIHSRPVHRLRRCRLCRA